MNKKVIMRQKAQHVTSLIFLLFLILTGYSQKSLEGNYFKQMGTKEHYENLVFYPNGEFEYHQGASLGDSFYGKGEYQLKNGKLILDFNKTSPKPDSHYQRSYFVNAYESILFKVTITDLKGNPIPGANISLKDRREGAIADENGKINAEFDRMNGKDILIVSNIGFKEIQIPVNNDVNYELKVFLAENNSGNPILLQTTIYDMLSMEEDSFQTRDGSGEKATWKRLK